MRLIALALLGVIAATAPTFAADEPVEVFVASGAPRSFVLEMRSEATVHGAEVKLRQVCRWADSDAQAFAPTADLVIARCKPGAAFQSISLEQIRQTLREAGVNVAMVRFAGPTVCTIGRSDAAYNENNVLQEWIDAKKGDAPATPAGEAPIKAAAVLPASPAVAEATRAVRAAAESPVVTLREILTADAAARLSLPAEMLQITFSPADEKVLLLAGPQFKFNIESRQLYNLGDVAWEVRIITEGGSKKVRVAATASAWQNEVVLSRPVAFKQVIRESDITERRTLVLHTTDEPLVTREQAIGQQCARDLKSGTVLTARMLDPVQLVSIGQFVSLTLQQGGVQIKTTARALEAASYGQTIRVKNEATGDVYEALISGPQEGTLSPVTHAPESPASANTRAS